MTDSESCNLPVVATPAPLASPQAAPPEDLAALVREHPGLLIAGGIAVGLLAGALIPRRAGGSLSKRAMALAAMAGEVGLALSQQARHRAEDAARDGREKLADLSSSAGQASRRAARSASAASADLRQSGLKLARKAVKLAVKAKG